jgi:hypothetical protein
MIKEFASKIQSLLLTIIMETSRIEGEMSAFRARNHCLLSIGVDSQEGGILCASFGNVDSLRKDIQGRSERKFSFHKNSKSYWGEHAKGLIYYTGFRNCEF